MGTATFPAAPGITAIDTRMFGRYIVTSAYLVDGERPTLVETGPTTSVEAVLEGLAKLRMGPEDLANILVTHIHLDHAGGVGRLAAAFPRATVWVHERGAPHLADPARLLSSAARVYGGEERIKEMFGPMDAVPTERLRPLSDGDRVDLGSRHLDIVYTPGHASHHVSPVDSATGAVFTGDALGIHLPDVKVLRPATPPPDIDVEAYVESIGRIRERADSVLLFSHFGPVRQVEELCELAAARIRKWADIVRDALGQTDELDRVAEILRANTMDEFEEAADPPSAPERYELLSGTTMNAAGLARYWRKRAEREAVEGPAEARRPGPSG